MSTAHSRLRQRSVFINCPYDTDFRPAFDAIIFATVCCGFEPRSATETGTTADSRMDRIVKSLRGSQYSIHDLSRLRGEGTANLARLNMPFELGIAMAMRQACKEGETDQDHDWMVLVPGDAAYDKVISDLNGYDLRRYDGSIFGIVSQVMSWLFTRGEGLASRHRPIDIFDALPDYDDALRQLRAGWNQAETWQHVVDEARAVGRTKGLLAAGKKPRGGAGGGGRRAPAGAAEQRPPGTLATPGTPALPGSAPLP